jgi:putative transposase
MPDHLHLLLEGSSGASDFRRCIKDVKQRTSYSAIRLGIGRLWQQGFHDRILRQNEDVRRYIDYIAQNPIRAGLVVDCTANYPYVSVAIAPGSDD